MTTFAQIFSELVPLLILPPSGGSQRDAQLFHFTGDGENVPLECTPRVQNVICYNHLQQSLIIEHNVDRIRLYLLVLH